MDGGRMDRFDLMPGGSKSPSPPNLRQLRPVQPEHAIPNYWAYAGTFTLGRDHLFSSAFFSQLLGNHLYTIAAQASGAIGIPGLTTSGSDINGIWGCLDSPLASLARVSILSPTGDGKDHQGVSLFRLSHSRRPHRRRPAFQSPHSPGNTLRALRRTARLLLECLRCRRSHSQRIPDWTVNMVPETQFISDALNGQLASVNWLVTPPQTSEHPPDHACLGENDNGRPPPTPSCKGRNGAPPRSLYFGTTSAACTTICRRPRPAPSASGPRVPLIIVSPYAKPGYISKTVYSFESLLSFAENIFGLPPLLPGDALANSVADSFDFTQSPLPPLILEQRTLPQDRGTVRIGYRAGGRALHVET